MQYIRKHYQRNLLSDDEKNIPKGHIENNVSVEDKYIPEWKAEAFLVKSMNLYTNTHHYTFTEKDTNVVVENSNYFTVVNKDLKNISNIRFEDVTYFEFELAPSPMPEPQPQQ